MSCLSLPVVSLRPRRSEQGTASASTWSSVTFEVVARASVVPVIASPQLLTVDAQGQRMAPTIAGTVTGPLAVGAYVDISIDGTGDTPDITLVVGADGTYRYAPPSLSVGSHTVRVRVRTYDSQTRSTVSTGWQSTTVTKAASAGPTLIVGGTSPSAPSSSSGTTTSGSSVASPEQAVGSTVGAIQGAVTGAQGNLTTALSSTISPLASAAGLTACCFNSPLHYHSARQGRLAAAGRARVVEYWAPGATSMKICCPSSENLSTWW